MTLKTVKMYPPAASNPYRNLSAEDSVEVGLSDVLVDDSVIEFVKTGKPPLPDSVVLTPYLSPPDDQFPNDTNASIVSYTGRSFYEIGDKNILVIAFFCDINGSDWSGERYTFTPVLFHGNAHTNIVSVCAPIRFDFTEDQNEYGYRKWKRGSLYTVPVALRIIGAARYVKILCYQENHMWPWTGTDWDYGSPYAYFPNVKTGRLYVGAI